jgi:hypothetical protein
MLDWLQFSGQPLEAVDGRRGRGEKISVNAKKLADLVVDVELTADVPTDRMARINAASMAVRDLGYSRERALEQIGETDAREVMRQAAAEELEAVELEIEKQRMLAEAKQELDNKDKGERIKEKTATGVDGNGFNPAAGGTPPVVANPDAVAEANSED